MIDLLASSDGLSTYRCDIVNFPIPKAQLLGQITITINRLVTSTPEVPDCALAQEKLDSAGITIKCSDAEGFFGYEIIQKPDSLTEGQTSDIVHESFMDIVSGPWVFIVNLEK